MNLKRRKFVVLISILFIPGINCSSICGIVNKTILYSQQPLLYSVLAKPCIEQNSDWRFRYLPIIPILVLTDAAK